MLSVLRFVDSDYPFVIFKLLIVKHTCVITVYKTPDSEYIVKIPVIINMVKAKLEHIKGVIRNRKFKKSYNYGV